jgi:hypothetical protein
MGLPTHDFSGCSVAHIRTLPTLREQLQIAQSLAGATTTSNSQ